MLRTERMFRLLTLPATFALFLALMAQTVYLSDALTFRCEHGTWGLRDGAERSPLALPLSFDRQGIFTVTCDVPFTLAAPQYLEVQPDECLESLTLNGNQVDTRSFPICEYDVPTTIDVRGLLHAGTNRFEAVVRNVGGIGGLQVHVAHTDTLRMLPIACLLLLCTLFGLLLTFLYGRTHAALCGLLWLAALGTVLRVSYASVTPLTVRGHDWDGHVAYIEHVADHWTLPLPSSGWQMYQPPLYYFLNAPVFKLAQQSGLPRLAAWSLVQNVSLLLSLLTLAAALWGGLQLFDAHRQKLALWTYAAVMALCPGLIFLAPRVNNDVLEQLWAFVSFGLLLRWWNVRRTRDWVLLSVCVALGLVTKTNIILLLPLILLCLLNAPGLTRRATLLLSAVFVTVIVTGAGWYTVLRAGQTDDSRSLLVGNYRRLTNFVENSPVTLTVFNPVEVLRHPYNNPYSNEARRAYLWEYLYRTVFTGEFDFGAWRLPLVRLMLLFGFVPLFFLLGRALWELLSWERRTLPVWAGFWILIGAQFLQRLLFPYSSSQDFRFSVILLVPAAFYLGQAMLWRPLWAKGLQAIIILMLLAAAAFDTTLYLLPA